MGKSILNTVIDLLSDQGSPAAPALPKGNMLTIHAPVAAVSIEKVDTAERVALVMVEVVAPMQSGGVQCQNRALEVCRILSAAGAQCVQDSCSFDSRAALFCVPVTARFYGTATADDWIPLADADRFTYKLNDTLLEYVQSFSASQAMDNNHEVLATAPLEFSLEEFFPFGVQEPEHPAEPFTLQVETEVYSGCTLTQWQRVYTAQGIQQIRKGIAALRAVQ